MESPTQKASPEPTKNADKDTYEQYASLTGISVPTLVTQTKLEYWTEEIELSDETTQIQLNSYAACSIVELRASSASGVRTLENYRLDFAGWEYAHFNQLGRAFRRELVLTLQRKGLTFEVGKSEARTLYGLLVGEHYFTAPPELRTASSPDIQRATPYEHQREQTLTQTPMQGTPHGNTTRPTPAPTTTPYEPAQGQYQPHTIAMGYNPYQLPPMRDVRSEKPSPEKIIQFQKAWKKENNYTGQPYDILADKAMVFIELCRRLDIDESSYANLFPDILEGRAHMFYLHNIGPGLTWKSLYERLSNHFNTNVNHNQYWTDWTTMSFARIKQENPSKTPHEALETMIDKLTLAQRALGPQFQGEIPLHTAVVRACRGQPELEQAMFSIKPTCEALFSDLRAALQISIDRQHNAFLTEPPDAYYTDRRYNLASRTRSFGQRGRSPRGSYRGQPRSRSFARTSSRDNHGRTKRCFVCHKEGCWSSNHPRTDRSRAKRQYIYAYEGFHDETPSREEVTAYIQEFEGELDHEEDDSCEEGPDIEDDEGEEAINYLTSAAFLHRTTAEDIYSLEPEVYAEQFILEDRYRTTYQGELWDTGAAKISTVGKAQLEAYVRDNPRTKIDWTPSKENISFGGQGATGSVGTVRITNPIGTVTYHILDTPTPFLLSLADADRLGAYFNNVLNVIVRKDGTTIPVVRKWGHPFFNVRKEEAMSFFTETELRRLHRRFGHPRTERLYNMLKNAGHDVNPSVLDEIKKFCHMCQSHDPAPRRFKFTIKDDSHFNYEIVIDTVRIGNGDVLHAIDTSTSFQAATFLKSMSARDTWEALCKCWINTYQGPPDYIVHDPGTNFASEDFRSRAKIVGATCRQMPIEAHWAVGKIERAHAPLRRTYDILRAELDSRTDDESVLQMAVKALNDTAGPNGLVPTLLVFGAYPRINIDSAPSPDIIARANAVRKAMKMLQSERAKVDINRAINTRNGPITHEVLNLPLGTEVQTWREKKGWRGPYKILAFEDRDVVVDGANGPIKLRCTQVKPYFRAEETNIDPQPHDVTDPDEPLPVRRDPSPTRRRGRPRKNVVDSTTKGISHEQEKNSEGIPIKRKRGRPRKNNTQTPHDNTESPHGDTSPPQPRRYKSKPHPRSSLNRDKHPFALRGGKRRIFLDGESREVPPQNPPPRRNPVRRSTQAFLTQKEKDDFALAVKLRAEGVITTPGEPFEESDRTEMESLIAGGTFEVLSYDPLIHKGRIFNLRLVREIKGKSTQPYEKSRLVLAGHSDAEKEEILTQSPTIQRMSQRLILAIDASLIASYGMHCELRDITQAYVQSADKLTRTLYARPPKELQGSFPPRTILRVVRPLYGAAESGLYWFKTYHNHHKEKLRMITSSYDPCLLLTNEGTNPFGITGLQTDDTISIVTADFARREEEALQEAKFRAKPKTVLTHDQPLEFNGGKIQLVRDKIVLTQKGQAKNLRTVDLKAEDAAQKYVEQRARGAYIASVCQPEAAFDLSTAAQTTTPSHEDIKALNVRIQWQIDNQDRGLSYVPLDLQRTKLFIFTDGSFANNKDLSSQLGFLIVLGNEHRTGTSHDFEIQGNIVHWNSSKCKRVTRSVLASELYGMVGGFDCAIALSTTLQQLVRTLQIPAIPVVICTDSRSLYECLVKLGTTNEKRLMIDIMSLRESYEKREIAEIRWINGKDNPADACTKKTPNIALEKLITHNRLTIKVEASVDRLGLARDSQKGIST